MDRRRFFSTFLATPLLAPLLWAARRGQKGSTLYIIGENPHLFFSPLLAELEKPAPAGEKRFRFLCSHPQEDSLKQILLQQGWQRGSGSNHAELSISYRRLQVNALPSFTMVKGGKVWDMRSWRLRSLWEEMKKKDPPSSCLTVVSSKNQHSRLAAGDSVSVYIEGLKRGEYSLREERSVSFPGQNGPITIQIAGGEARVMESSCQGRICLCSPPVSRAGERIICAPNHFFMEVQGSSVDTVIG